MEMNKKIMEHLSFSSQEERQNILKMFEVVKREPVMSVVLAILRDSYVFRDMAQATILRQNMTIKELEQRIAQLEQISN